ncbi:zinc finger protein 518A [Otolemur garnettii]|uniref:Zinc finger protein 518A n=1 Tax=Otolemur garnettii TaxID=30611 RepID=H0XU75_OTOGA|nr:zinc finger protein 518A [Otolemur garnettii]
MPSEQKQFCDEKQTTLKKDYDVKSEIIDTIRLDPKPKILESSFHYDLKNVKIDLPKINIPNEVLSKHEVDKYRKLFLGKPQTARKSISIKTVSCIEECMLLHKSERAEEEGIKMSAKILNFNCLKCQDNTRYSPNDLQKHFQMWHHGELPSYPCEMCSFSANDFQVFKQHRRTHRSTLVKCDICNNESVYTLLELTKHFASKHCVNGNFQCEKCKFSTQDVGTFVQHIHRHNEIHYECDKCHHVCYTKGELQKHLHVHSGTLPFTCQYCSYGATRREHLVRHVITLHKEHLYAKEKLEKDKYEKRMAKTSGLKLILKRYKIGASRKTFWKRKKINNGSDRSIEKNTQGLKKMNKTQPKSEDQSHPVQKHLSEDKEERLHCANNDKPSVSESEKPTLLSPGQCSRAEEGPNATSGLLKTAVQGPTVLMVKNNKITIPANYSAKFMGFKMVDGKQHIVIKLLPANKQNLHSQSGATKESTADLQPQTLDTTGLLTGVTTELSNPAYMKTATPFSCSSPVLLGKIVSEKEMALIAQRNNITLDYEKSVSSSPASELIPSVNLTTKVETRDNVDLWGNHITQSHPELLSTTIKSPDKVNHTTKSVAYNNGDMHNYCINYVNSELPIESSSQGSLPFHNYSKVNNFIKRPRFSGTAMCDSPQRESSSSKTALQQPISESVLSLVRKESSKPDSLLSSISLSNDKDGTLKTKVETEEQCVLGKEQNIEQNLYSNENQNLESVIEKSKWDDISSVDSPMMPRITSVFSLQSQQASEFLPPEINQLLQDVLKIKSDVKQDSNNTPHKDLPLNCHQSFQRQEGEGKIAESSKDFKVQGTFPVSPHSVSVNVPTSDLNLKCNGKEKQGLSVSQDVKDSEKTPRISGFGTLLKTQSDAIITQQLVKDKLRATTQNLGTFYMQSPFLNSEPGKTFFVQTPKGFFVPLNVANKPGLHVISGRQYPLVSAQGVPASLILNKKPGMIFAFNSKKVEDVSTVKTESPQACGTVTMEPCKTPFLKVEPNNNCLTPALCSSIGNCLNVKSSSENTLSLKGPYIIKTSAASAVKTIPTPNKLSEHQGTKLNILDSVKQQNEIFPKPPLYTLLPDGKQAVFLKCVMPNTTELLKPKLVQNSTYYQNIQPKKPEGTPQRILLKIFNPVLNVTAANNLSVSNSASSLQKDNVPSNQTIGGEQKEPESSKDALSFLQDDLMPANEIVITSTATCPESSGEQVRVSDCPEARVLRCKTNSTVDRNFNRKKASKKNFSRVKTRLRSKDSEVAFVSRNRNYKRKCRNSYQEPPVKKPRLHRKCKEKSKPEDGHGTYGISRPRLPKDSVRTLRLFPFSSNQLVKCPRRNQPVVVLNHPDVDAPEVVNVMKTIAKFNGRVLKVSLSQRTINALLNPVCYNPSKATYDDFSKRHKTFKPVSSVKERFVLKLTLKKTSKNNYQIVKTTSENILKAKFNCWFCGRIFDNQDIWAGHGQRHLMEATRDWNMLE